MNGPMDADGADVASRSGTWSGTGPEPSVVPVRANFQGILRKEVIQPQVPLRLPCYDLVPIKSFIFDAG